ncbi:Hippurate hydrolase [Cupriavidus necator]|uniref:Amidohydrolase n=1 Tax=Cupriavidus necator (strain ATCC 17699 / DSM 428 / KCTC 22496 / NCIMB 10442 / H16 / Stanier 337) TaxID=381666 RepID=Q0K3M2_CUPNH|nr:MULTISPECIES: M20 aminoacylase family protein [Cupriavidus]EON19128.1 metal-dependent amidase/aminoacylase/carboxypeptidase [Cupriavidus sp. GA3-3]QCC03308.1 amidohydrolase [Cupriavidus necator H16]QQB80365.1 amidohydrolase [Cupriavidus necator]WKA44640.1 M20 aminoacylase family protein [Cupriavidus necator]CAJ95402.1 Metal-dependent amidase/aminoacylase/carboxypeptidase [Cupriavidus necator H16]
MHAILESLRSRADKFVALRRDIHQHPELGFQEHRTSDAVAERLAQWGYDVERGLGGTGVVGRLRRGSGTRRLGLRADMDALPIGEATGLPYSSSHAGVMHACGHDGHTAMLLCAAEYLAQEAQFSGTLNLIFQPAEEGMGGAVRMIQDGLFEKYPCDAVFAMHNMPGITQGRLVLRDGPTMASSDYATVTVRGVGGHGALPHRAADPLVAAAGIVLALQTVVSRNVDPLQMAVVTVGAMHAGKANNVIPQEATLEISVRALDRDVRATLERRIKALVQAQAESYGVRAEIDYRQGYAVLVNTPEETEFARQTALALLGPDKVVPQGPALPGSEDFAFMLERCPGSYLLIGNGDGDSAGACMVHNPGYDFNDDNVTIGAAYWALLTQRFLID